MNKRFFLQGNNYLHGNSIFTSFWTQKGGKAILNDVVRINTVQTLELGYCF